MRASNPELEVRLAVEADFPHFARIYNQSIAAADASTDREIKSGDFFARMVRGFHEREALLALTRRDEPIGFAVIKRYSDRAGYRAACETSLYLSRNERRKGYGTFFKRDVIARCRRLCYRHLVGRILARNAAAIAYNQRLGYEIVGVQREIARINGRWEDVVIMQLILPDAPPPNEDAAAP